MFSLIITTQAGRKTILVGVADTISSTVEANGVTITSSTLLYLNGGVLSDMDIDKTFADFGVNEDDTAMFTAVIKATAN